MRRKNSWNKLLPVIVFSFIILILLISTGLKAQDQEKILEKITVTNVEIPVRVEYKGKPVTDLKKEDFTVYENNQKVDINGFFLKRKQIKAAVPSEETTTEQVPLSRTFVLVFSITDFNENLEKAVDHLFNNIFRPNDRLLILANDKTIEYLTIENRDEIKNKLMNELREQSLNARHRLEKYILQVENYLKVHDFRVKVAKRDEPADRLIDFLQKYLITWNEYKKNYLTPRIDRFYYFARYLEKIKSEKWVFNFYQFDLFPHIRIASDTMNTLREIAEELSQSEAPSNYSMGRLLNTIVNQTLIDLNVGSNYPSEDISKLFYKVDATFHSFFITNLKKTGGDDFEYKDVASDIEKTLKDITRLTGGENITSNDLVNSIETVSGIEDAYYMLSYVPLNSQKAGKVKVTVSDKKYKVMYDDNFREDYIAGYLEQLDKKTQTPGIKIEGFSFENKVLAFTIKEYAMGVLDKAKAGRMKVRIRLLDKDNNQLFSDEKILTAQKKEMKISLNTFKTIKKGEYNFSIDVVDMLTEKEANLYQNVIVKE